MRVWVYRNLKHGKEARPLYSVLYKGRVIRRVHRILLTDCAFKVREAGRQRVLKVQQKNAHAFVIGNIPRRGAFGIDHNGKDLPVRIKYDPYKAGHFMTEDGMPVAKAWGVLLNEHGCTACYLGQGAAREVPNE